MPTTNGRVVLTLLTAGLLVACESAQTADSTVAPGFDDSGDCRSEFEPLVKRAGTLGLLTLGYDCGASDCTGEEAFGENLRHDVRVDLPYDGIPRLTLTSDDVSVARVEIKQINLDDCASEAQAFVQIETKQAGSTRLRIHNDGVEIDNIEIRVETARALTLRATALSDFDLSDKDDTIEATLGEALLVMPRLLDKDAHPLLGTPSLIWQSEDDDVASVREVAVSDEEEILRSTTTDSSVFVDPLSAGHTVIIAKTSEDVAASLSVRVRDDED